MVVLNFKIKQKNILMVHDLGLLMVIPSNTTGEEGNGILCNVDNDDIGLENPGKSSGHCSRLEDPG